MKQLRVEPTPTTTPPANTYSRNVFYRKLTEYSCLLLGASNLYQKACLTYKFLSRPVQVSWIGDIKQVVIRMTTHQVYSVPSMAHRTAVCPVVSLSVIAASISSVTTRPLRFIHSRLPINTLYTRLALASAAMSTPVQHQPSSSNVHCSICYVKKLNNIAPFTIKQITTNLFIALDPGQSRQVAPDSVKKSLFPCQHYLSLQHLIIFSIYCTININWIF